MTTPRHLIAAITLLLVSALTGGAAGVKTVRGEFTYLGDRNETREQCRAQALQGARVQALAKEFGMLVSDDTFQHETMTDREQSTYYSSLSLTSVKGEWIADVGEPKFEYSLDNEGCYVVKCTVTGTAREISNEAVEFEALALRNGTTSRHSDTRFRSGDDMYLYFRAPSDGYIACFLADDRTNVYALLPYQDASRGEVKVKRGKEYVFFDPAKADRDHGPVDEIMLSTESVERNSLYVVFSPNPFSLTADSRSSDGAPRSLSSEAFAKWLSKSRRNDTKMGVKIINLEITKE